MGRKDLLTILGNEIAIDNSHIDDWLVYYTFTRLKVNPNFFSKLTELTNRINRKGTYAEKSRNVFMTRDLHGAITATKLAKHYGAFVNLYRVHKIDTAVTLPLDYELILEPRLKKAVMKAICNQLKNHCGDIPSSDVDVLGSILYSEKYLELPSLPLQKEVYEDLIKECTSFPFNDHLDQTSYGITIDDVIPILRAIENYLKDYKNNGTEDVELLYNMLARVESEDNGWVKEPSVKIIEKILKSQISYHLSLQIQDTQIANEMR